ncbi:MAG TPA: glycosyltransferase family 4 protein [Niabella sp.]|nr:glycosyltransferase family 4 protein [Niabella sp.]
MPSILFVCLHRQDRSPSQRFRFEQYLPYLRDNGYEIKFSFLLDAADDKKFYSPGKYFAKFRILIKAFCKRFREAFFSAKPDIVFVQRECFMLGTSFFEKRFSKRAKLIFDFDDSIWLQNVSAANKRLGFLKNPDKTKEIIKVSNLVIAGNQYLAHYALQFNKNVVIIPTTIDTVQYIKKEIKDKEKVVVGWSGSFSTIQHFEFAIDALSVIKKKYGNKVEFMVIGDGNYRNEELGIVGTAWNAATEVQDLHKIDIGIMPLPDDEWANGKCGLKGLQYMAAGIPTIMSPVGVNTEIIQDGVNGFLASAGKEWVEKISLLIDSLELRKKFSENGRKTVEEKYSVQSNKHLYLKHLNTILER